MSPRKGGDGGDSLTSDDEEMQQRTGLISKNRTTTNERSAGMNRIHQQVSQVSSMFRDLSNIVVSQGESVATIEQTVDNAASNIKEVNVQLKVSQDRRKQLKDLIFILGCLVMFVLGVSIYRRNSNSS